MVALLGCGACTSNQNEVHVAPLFTRVSSAGGGIETEALGGALISRRRPGDFARTSWAFRPLYSHAVADSGDRTDWFLPPFGNYKVRDEGRDKVWQLLPIARYAYDGDPDGQYQWSFLSLPGVYWSRRRDGTVLRAWFPFGGVVRDFLSVDYGWFVLFPLYAHVERYGRTTRHVLFPFFKKTSGPGGPSWRVWPIVGRNHWEGHYDRWFFLWPFFHVQRNGLLRGEENAQRSFLFWPFFGISERGPARSYTALWPFFGYTTDPDNGFWAWDGPWPLVVFQGGDPDRAVRSRIWPFYSYYRGDGLESRYYLWPFFNQRKESYPDADKERAYLLPFWHSWDRVDADGHSSWRKLWPAYRLYREENRDHTFFAFPALNPLWRTPIIDEHYAWMYELFTTERTADRIRERSWLGLWRRERDRDEDRRSLAGVWARRSYTQGGEPAVESSWLFGLIRTRRGPHGFRFLAPSVPGPGWPLERTPNSIEGLEQNP